MEDLSRRNFLKGAGVAAAGAALAGALSACSSEQTASEDWLPVAWDYETDVVVIGYGGAGIWAALTAKDEGESDVLVLEKAPVRGGGNSSINMGEFTWVEDTEQAVKYITGFSLGWTTEEMARAWAEECYKNLDYCDYWGIEAQVKKGTNASGGFSSCEYPYIEGSETMRVCSVGNNGNGFWQQLDAIRADLGIEVVFSCHDEELIQNPETKEIVGCYTLIGDDATPKAVKARKGIILTLGGFEFNEDMKQQYLRCYPMKGFYGWPFNTGDGINMVLEINAQLSNMNNAIGDANSYLGDSGYEYAFQLSPRTSNFVYLDRLGKRWFNESGFFNPHLGWHEFTKFNDATLCDFERIPTWVICDKNAVQGGPLGLTKGGALSVPGVFETAMGMALDDVPAECFGNEGWSEDNSPEIEKGWIKKGNTIEELLMQIDEEIRPDIETALTTIKEYNQYCANGVDSDLGRDAGTLLPVAEGPFYAYPLYPGGCTTLGGPAKNTNAQVLDTKNEVIPRLYAAGSFGNFQRHTYGISGGGNGENMVWGRIAARHVSNLEPWDAE
jgi:succinate dehydrogenase/fumarate reductase flavoprotein subunit